MPTLRTRQQAATARLAFCLPSYLLCLPASLTTPSNPVLHWGENMMRAVQDAPEHARSPHLLPCPHARADLHPCMPLQHCTACKPAYLATSLPGPAQTSPHLHPDLPATRCIVLCAGGSSCSPPGCCTTQTSTSLQLTRGHAQHLMDVRVNLQHQRRRQRRREASVCDKPMPAPEVCMHIF